MPTLYVDADGCPVKSEVYRVAARYSLPVFVVANMSLRVPPRPGIQAIVVPGNLDAADDWIAENIEAWDICITNDIPLADRCLSKGAFALRANGKLFTDDSIGSELATRELLKELRSAGTITGGPPPFSSADRSKFLSKLDELIQKSKREKARQANKPKPSTNPDSNP